MNLQLFYNYVIRLAEGFNWLDAVFDCYFKNSLKAQTRKGQGSSGTQVFQITDDVHFFVIQIIDIIW